MVNTLIVVEVPDNIYPTLSKQLEKEDIDVTIDSMNIILHGSKLKLRNEE